MAFRIERPATAFSSAPAKGARRPRRFHQEHLRFIRTLPCCVCGTRKFVEAAHVRMASAIHGKRETGIGEKPSDEWSVPLCARHHQEDQEAQHRIGEAAFWSKHGIDPFALALALWCTTAAKARYVLWLEISDCFSELTFATFCRRTTVRRAA